MASIRDAFGPATPVVIFNGVAIVVTIVLTIILTYAGSKFIYSMGITSVQERLKWIILRTLLLLLGIGIAATIVNLIDAFYL